MNSTEERRKIFTDIFTNKKWDRDPTEDRFSGMGSRPENTAAYENLIVDLCHRYGIKTIADIGCGDFQVARRWLVRVPEINYLGCDIVSEIVDAHQLRFGTDRINFRQLDAVVDQLPKVDLILMREVLQHLSNSSIAKVIPKIMDSCRWALITECVRRRAEIYNADIREGRQTRIGKKSGVFLEKSPFNIKVKPVLTIPHAFSRKKKLRTVLITGRLDRNGVLIATQNSGAKGGLLMLWQKFRTHWQRVN
jgi:hypothetical protein